MRSINEYSLYDGPTEDYNEIKIPVVTELKLPRDSQVLSVLVERNSQSFSIKVYVEEDENGDEVTKRIALVTKDMPDKYGIGWRFLNSLVVSTGPESHPKNTPYHAYVKIC